MNCKPVRALPPLVGLLLAAFFSAPVSAEPAASSKGAAPSTETATSALQRFVDDVSSFEADFVQVQRDDTGFELERSEGHFWLQRPGRFRWEVRSPFPQTVVADGETLWTYEPDLAQVTRRPADAALAGTPAELLADGSALATRFRIVAPETETALEAEGAEQVVRLEPRSDDSDFQSVTLLLANGVPRALVFADQLGGQTTVRFSNITVNGDIAPERLRFAPPKGADVVVVE
ncbi:outer membrane lipoprotein chaperone LolA [Algiphilus sp.]|uniref:outer membrane lipoprotein chaperone LolA n=1 Tax=Algiphilus sp. TaxID=1872431 RepID=UPI003B52EA96